MSSTPASTDSPVIQPMHIPTQAAVVQLPQAPLGNSTNGASQAPGQGTKAMLAKRLASMGGNPKYISPTDNMMTPCTAKINQSKKKHFNKGKSVQLFMKNESVPEPDEEIVEETLLATEETEQPKVDAMMFHNDAENPF